ncbi:9484_t:CDS:1, partial [Cetraspora pellucida]
MSVSYTEILDDLITLGPATDPVTPPYTTTDDLATCVTLAFVQLKKANQLRNRIHVLTYGYYLGMVYANMTPDQVTHLKKLTTNYYYLTSMRVYDIFSKYELEQIYCTQRIKFRDIHLLNTEDIRR